MVQDSDNKLEDMNLSPGARITKFVSVPVLWLLDFGKTEREYFETSFSLGDEHELQIVRKFFHEAFWDRSRFYIPILLLVVGLIAADLCLTFPIGPPINACSIMPIDLKLQAYGIVLDALGAIFIALGLFRGPKELLIDTPMRGGGGGTLGGASPIIQPGPLSSIVRSTVDGVYGALFFLIGFTIQFLAVSNIS